MRELCHSSLALPKLGLAHCRPSSIEVWASDSADGEQIVVTLSIEADETVFADLLPHEARALAALLLSAAENQERRIVAAKAA